MADFEKPLLAATAAMPRRYTDEPGFSNYRRRSTCKSVLLLATLLAALVIIFGTLFSPEVIRKASRRINTPTGWPLHRFLFVAVPAAGNGSSVHMCKTVITLQTLNYPTPDLIDWTEGLNGSIPRSKNKQDILRVAKLREWLDLLPVESETGLVVLMSEPGAWFQLRPDVLLQRYHHIVASHAENGSHHTKARAGDSVVFSSQPACVDPRNYTINSCHSVSGAHLSERLILGSVRSLRALLHVASQKQARPDDWEAATAFDQIFGEQQNLRAAVARGEHPPQHELDAHLDFDIILDTEHTLSVAAAEVATEQPESLFGKMASLSRDISGSMKPLWTPTFQEQWLPNDTSWTNVNLFSIPRPETVPVIVHHEPTKRGQDKLSTEWWQYLWLHPFARELLTVAEHIPTTVVGRLSPANGPEQLFWSPARYEKTKVGVTINHKRHALRPWQEICGSPETTAEIFRDDKGPWQPIMDFKHYI